MKVVWSDEALQDLLDAYDYIAQDNPVAAGRVQQQLVRAAENLTLFPNRGRTRRRDGAREIMAAHTPYLIVYVVEEDVVIIARLWHTSRRPYGDPAD